MGSTDGSGTGPTRPGVWAIWAVDQRALEARLIATFDAHGPALAALLELQAASAWADRRLVLTSRPGRGHARLPVQRVDADLALASCLVGCADGRRHVRA